MKEPSLFFSRCVGAADEADGSDGSFCYGLRWRPPKCFAGETPCRRGDGSFSPGDFGSCFIGNFATIQGRIVSLLCSLWCDSCAFFGSLQLKRVRADMSLQSLQMDKNSQTLSKLVYNVFKLCMSMLYEFICLYKTIYNVHSLSLMFFWSRVRSAWSEARCLLRNAEVVEHVPMVLRNVVEKYTSNGYNFLLELHLPGALWLASGKPKPCTMAGKTV